MSDNARIQAQKCLKCLHPHCVDGCPVKYDVPSVMKCVLDGDFDNAFELIGHPFGEICSYVCPHFKSCVGNCVLNGKNDPVRVCDVERAVYQNCNYRVVTRSNKLHSVKVAVIGGGVAGCTFAYKLLQHGADVTVYEKSRLLSTVNLIAESRLPKSVTQKVSKFIYDNVKVVNSVVNNEQFDEIKRTFDVVYVATGFDKEYKLGIDNESLVTSAYDFLTDNYGRNVAVIGGGNTAMDCARVVAERGGQATVLYRRQLADMPAFVTEIDEVTKLGVKFVFNVAPIGITQSGNNLLLTLAQTVSDGRKGLTITDNTFTESFDTVVSALGAGYSNAFGLPCEHGKVVADDVGYVTDNVYVGGDIINGEALVSNAVASAITTANYVTEKYGKE